MNPLSLLFKTLTQLRFKFYKENFLKRIKLPIPVISIGNLTMGGTGKTPFTIWLLEKYQEQYKIGVVVRSYKANLKSPQRVKINSSAIVMGDEALLIQNRLPQAIVYAGSCKFEIAQELYKNENPDFIIVDDGFQHLKLSRDLDIVLLDCSVPFTDYSWPLFGRLREDFSALSRASVVVLTKTEIKNEETYQFIKKQIPSSVTILESEQCIGKLRSLRDGSLLEDSELLNFKDKKIFAFAGLARPENFQLTLKQLHLPVNEFLSLADHVNYTEDLIEEIISKAKNCDFCVTTEKDAVKLQEWPIANKDLFIVPIKLNVKGDVKGFYEKIDECIRAKH
jgi:tetraacyldisaccharide 4'-kinase